MSRLKQTFARLKAADRAAMIPFFTAGDPVPEVTAPMLVALAEAGADAIEIGIPFSDPMADGPTIQQANERALRHGVSLRHVLEAVRAFRQGNMETPVILMGYLNPIEVMGYARFAEAAAEAGVDAVITVDMSPEEAAEYVEALRQHQLDPVFLLAPTSQPARVQMIAGRASGFLYYVSMRGVTGSGNLDLTDVASRLEMVKAHTDLPVGVGFGIQDTITAAAVARIADAVVVGSAVVKEIAQADDAVRAVQRAAALVKGLADAVHGARG